MKGKDPHHGLGGEENYGGKGTGKKGQNLEGGKDGKGGGGMVEAHQPEPRPYPLMELARKGSILMVARVAKVSKPWSRL